VTTRGTFHRQGPFVGFRWPFRPRSCDCPIAFGVVTTAERRSHVVLGLSRPFPAFENAGRPTLQLPFRSAPPATLPRGCRCSARPPFTLPATLFWALRTSLFGARCCLPISATETRRMGTELGLPIPRRDGGHDHLPFLTHHARPPRVCTARTQHETGEAVRRGEPRIRPST